jgi:hypothetical protein
MVKVFCWNPHHYLVKIKNNNWKIWDKTFNDKKAFFSDIEFERLIRKSKYYPSIGLNPNHLTSSF